MSPGTRIAWRGLATFSEYRPRKSIPIRRLLVFS
jgi:hypothetical protein